MRRNFPVGSRPTFKNTNRQFNQVAGDVAGEVLGYANNTDLIILLEKPTSDGQRAAVMYHDVLNQDR